MKKTFVRTEGRTLCVDKGRYVAPRTEVGPLDSEVYLMAGSPGAPGDDDDYEDLGDI